MSQNNRKVNETIFNQVWVLSQVYFTLAISTVIQTSNHENALEKTDIQGLYVS